MTKKSAALDDLAPIIHDALTRNPKALNAVIAEEASQRLNRAVSYRDVSRVRNRLGLGVFHQLAERILKRLSNP